MMIIRAGKLIDGNSSEPLSDVCIFIDKGRIMDVQNDSSCSLPENCEIVDARALTVLPGMVDCHVHIHSPGGPDQDNNYALDPLSELQGTLALRAYANARKDLRMGFTTLRSLDSPGYVDVALRNAIDSGLLEGPRLRVAGQGISVTGGHMDKAYWNLQVDVAGRTAVGDGPWGCRRAARQQMKYGADVLKINACGGILDLEEPWHQEMTYDEMAAVCEEARRAKLRVAAHTSGGHGITDAIRAGVNSIEHGQWLSDEQIDLMVEKGVFYVPTLTTNARGIFWGQEALKSSDEEWAWLMKTEEDKWDSLARAKQAGVQVVTGTDAGFWIYHGENATEIEMLVKGGFSPMEAIMAATRVGAACLGMEKEIGTIEKGKWADLVLVSGDPLADVRILQDAKNITAVYKAGRVAV
jgi:imidazolonepropionase-like amidohydrolase